MAFKLHASDLRYNSGVYREDRFYTGDLAPGSISGCGFILLQVHYLELVNKGRGVNLVLQELVKHRSFNNIELVRAVRELDSDAYISLVVKCLLNICIAAQEYYREGIHVIRRDLFVIDCIGYTVLVYSGI